MVTRLRLVTPIRSDQTLTSYVGELAAMNFQPATDDFCRDVGITLHAVAMGEAKAIQRIALVSGSDLEVLERAAFRRTENKSVVFRGQTLTHQVRAPMQARFCTDCLKQDIETAAAVGMRRPHHHVYGRPQWYAAQYRTCTRHGGQLAAVRAGRGSRQHDFAGTVLPLLDRLDEIRVDLVRRPASDFEHHLERRLQGNGAPGLLGALGFSATARLCEMLGAVALFGRWPAHLGFDDARWHEAGAEGYRIANGGPEAILSFLGELRKAAERDSRDGPHNDWGILYNWLEDTRDPELEPLLDLLRGHIEDNYPSATGKRVFGRLVKDRKVHSIWTASVEYGVHADVLRTQLAAAGVIENDPERFDNHVLFPAGTNRSLLERLSRGVSALHARERINCERQQFAPLVEAGLLSPIVDVPSGYPLFDTADLDAFVAGLTANAVPYDAKPDGLETIATARMRCGCGQPEIVKLIQAGMLKSVGRLESETGYAAILVDPVEVAPLVNGTELGGIVVSDIVADLGIPHAGLVAMLDVQLPTEWRMHPRRRCPQQIVDDNVYAKFKAKYVSLRDLSRAAGVHARKCEVQLRHRGILAEAGFPPRVHLYLRSKLE